MDREDIERVLRNTAEFLASKHKQKVNEYYELLKVHGYLK